MKKEFKEGQSVIIKGVIRYINPNTDRQTSSAYPISVKIGENVGISINFTLDGKSQYSEGSLVSLFHDSIFDMGEKILVSDHMDFEPEAFERIFLFEKDGYSYCIACGDLGNYQLKNKFGVEAWKYGRKIKKVDSVEKEIEDAISVLERYGRVQDGKILKQG